MLPTLYPYILHLPQRDLYSPSHQRRMVVYRRHSRAAATPPLWQARLDRFLSHRQPLRDQDQAGSTLGRQRVAVGGWGDGVVRALPGLPVVLVLVRPDEAGQHLVEVVLLHTARFPSTCRRALGRNIWAAVGVPQRGNSLPSGLAWSSSNLRRNTPYTTSVV